VQGQHTSIRRAKPYDSVVLLELAQIRDEQRVVTFVLRIQVQEGVRVWQTREEDGFHPLNVCLPIEGHVPFATIFGVHIESGTMPIATVVRDLEVLVHANSRTFSNPLWIDAHVNKHVLIFIRTICYSWTCNVLSRHG
jgi:hypothetical protein